MTPIIEKISEHFKLGEGPHWDPKKQCLYFVSVLEHKIFRYVPSTKKLTSAQLNGRNVSIIIPVKGTDDQFVVTIDLTIALIKWDGESDEVEILKKLYEINDGEKNVFNDGKCDPSGRLWTGTMGHVAENLDIVPDGKGALYSFHNNVVTEHRSGIGVANGVAFDKGRKKMYYIDSYRMRIDQFDFDDETGTISNHQVIFTIETLGVTGFCVFDGMTIDTDGNLWIAVFNSSRVIKINPTVPETLLETIIFPATQVTSVAFGGENFEELYVTSARIREDLTDDDGVLFRVTGIKAKGLPADEFVL